MVDEPADGRLIRTARRFLRDTVEQFARLSRQYWDVVGEPPFIYSERQLHSVLFPAVVRASDAAFVEHPIRRTQRRTSKDGCLVQSAASHGWIDYWVLCGSAVFLVELKHAFRGVSTDGATLRLNGPWQAAIDQIGSITDDDAVDLATDANRVAKIALMVIPAYARSLSSDNLETAERDEALEAHVRMCSSMEPAPDWSAVWLLHERLQTACEMWDGSWELYPWVSFAAAIRPVASRS